jgi:23S rRNA (guanosine2251-2'-O)-methyltransferase
MTQWLFLHKDQVMRKLSNEELGRLDVEGFKQSEKNPVVVILDNVRSLNNIGSIFRSCDAFRITRLILCGISTPPPHRDIHKTALGAELSVDWAYFEHTSDAILSCKKEGYRVIALEQTESSIPLQQFKPIQPTPPLALIFGHEIHGVSQEVINICDTAVEIPQFGTKHSLNVAVSVGIVLWHVTHKSDE